MKKILIFLLGIFAILPIVRADESKLEFLKDYKDTNLVDVLIRDNDIVFLYNTSDKMKSFSWSHGLEFDEFYYDSDKNIYNVYEEGSDKYIYILDNAGDFKETDAVVDLSKFTKIEGYEVLSYDIVGDYIEFGTSWYLQCDNFADKLETECYPLQAWRYIFPPASIKTLKNVLNLYIDNISKYDSNEINVLNSNMKKLIELTELIENIENKENASIRTNVDDKLIYNLSKNCISSDDLDVLCPVENYSELNFDNSINYMKSNVYFESTGTIVGKIWFVIKVDTKVGIKPMTPAKIVKGETEKVDNPKTGIKNYLIVIPILLMVIILTYKRLNKSNI